MKALLRHWQSCFDHNLHFQLRFFDSVLCRHRWWLPSRRSRPTPPHPGHLLIANSDNVLNKNGMITQLCTTPHHTYPVGASGCMCGERDCHQAPVRTLCSSSTEGSRSLVNDHGAADEYVEVDMPPLLENTSNLTANCSFHTLLFVFYVFSFQSVSHVFFAFLTIHFPWPKLKRLCQSYSRCCPLALLLWVNCQVFSAVALWFFLLQLLFPTLHLLQLSVEMHAVHCPLFGFTSSLSSCWSFVMVSALLSQTRPSSVEALVNRGCPAGTHQRDLVSGVRLDQRANSCMRGCLCDGTGVVLWC